MVGGFIIAGASWLLERGMSANAVRMVVILGCVGVGFIAYIMENGVPPTNDLQSWAVVSMVDFGAAVGLYKWVLSRWSETGATASRDLMDAPPKKDSWI